MTHKASDSQCLEVFLGINPSKTMTKAQSFFEKPEKTKMQKLVKNLNLDWSDAQFKFLEHMYLRPINELKYFLKINEDSGVENVDHISGAVLIQRMEPYDLLDFELFSQKAID